MKETVLIDYAKPLMHIEWLVKKVHDLCLEHKYEQAQEAALRLTAEGRLLQTTLNHMKESK